MHRPPPQKKSFGVSFFDTLLIFLFRRQLSDLDFLKSLEHMKHIISAVQTDPLNQIIKYRLPIPQLYEFHSIKL